MADRSYNLTLSPEFLHQCNGSLVASQVPAHPMPTCKWEKLPPSSRHQTSWITSNRRTIVRAPFKHPPHDNYRFYGIPQIAIPECSRGRIETDLACKGHHIPRWHPLLTESSRLTSSNSLPKYEIQVRNLTPSTRSRKIPVITTESDTNSIRNITFVLSPISEDEASIWHLESCVPQTKRTISMESFGICCEIFRFQTDRVCIKISNIHFQESHRVNSRSRLELQNSEPRTMTKETETSNQLINILNWNSPHMWLAVRSIPWLKWNTQKSWFNLDLISNALKRKNFLFSSSTCSIQSTDLPSELIQKKFERVSLQRSASGLKTSWGSKSKITNLEGPCHLSHWQCPPPTQPSSISSKVLQAPRACDPRPPITSSLHTKTPTSSILGPKTH